MIYQYCIYSINEYKFMRACISRGPSRHFQARPVGTFCIQLLRLLDLCPGTSAAPQKLVCFTVSYCSGVCFVDKFPSWRNVTMMSSCISGRALVCSGKIRLNWIYSNTVKVLSAFNKPLWVCSLCSINCFTCSFASRLIFHKLQHLFWKDKIHLFIHKLTKIQILIVRFWALSG